MKILRTNRFFKFIVDELIKKGIMRILPDRFFIFTEYLIMTRKLLHLKPPRNFTEKIQWIKLYGHLEQFTSFVDKFEVRQFIKETIGAKYLVPIYGTWNKFTDIQFDKLPQKFVIKATHGSGYVFVCRDKSLLDKKYLKTKIDRWLKENFYIKTRERQYLNCKPKIICEKYLEDSRGDLADYKIFCYGGQPKIVEVVWDRFTNHKGDVYKDLNWKTLDISYVGYPHSTKKLLRPENLEQMLEIARKLSQNFPFVRVDLYSVNNRIYFGELTFTPANGMERFSPPGADYFLGKDINIYKY